MSYRLWPEPCTSVWRGPAAAAGLPGGNEVLTRAAFKRGVPQLALRGHLPDVAVRPHRVPHVRVDLGREPIGDREVRRWLPRVEDPHAPLAGQRAQLGIVPDERVQAAPDLQSTLDGAAQPAAPLLRQPAAHRGDADEDGRGAQVEAALEVAHDRDGAAEPQDLL